MGTDKVLQSFSYMYIPSNIGKRFACQCLDNVKMYKYAKFDQNIPGSSRVIMSIFINLEALSLFYIPVMLK